MHSRSFCTDFNKEERLASSRRTNSESSRIKSAHDYGWKSNSSFSVQAGSFKAISSTASCPTTVSFMSTESEKLLEKAGANLIFRPGSGKEWFPGERRVGMRASFTQV